MAANLNPQQSALINWIRDGEGSMNLVARAGTGKTYTLMQAVGEIIKNNSASIAIMAYNKSASNEFESRLEMLGFRTGQVTPGTVHSFGFRAWRQVAPRVKVEGNKVRDLVDARRREGIVYEQFWSQICKLVSLAKQHAFGVSTEIKDLDAWAHLLEHYDIDVNGHADEVIEASVEVYEASLAQLMDIVDFDDMILAPLIRNVNMKRYSWVLIDEAQDTNESRRLLALAMLAPHGRLIAVGDPRQAIYGFTGADSDALDKIKAVLNSAELPLSITYRCPKAVVAEANRLVPDLLAHESAPEGVVRHIQNVVKGEGADAVSQPWFKAENVSFTDVGLCRNTKPLLEEAYKMIALNVACRVEGRDIGEGLVQLATKWKRIVTLGALLDAIEEYQRKETAKWTERKNEARVQALEDKCETLRIIIDHLLATGNTSVSDLVKHIRSLFGDTPEGESPKVFTFSTIHKSKGREWDRVFFLYKSKTMPSKYAKQAWQLGQEANLEYVAITRAKKELVYVG